MKLRERKGSIKHSITMPHPIGIKRISFRFSKARLAGTP
jgi:hypothetical protein